MLVVAATAGVGDLPDATTVFFPPAEPAATVMEGLRRVFDLIEHPPDSVQAAVDAFDPGGEAVVIVPPFATMDQAFGRPVLGARRPDWVALEDKMRADDLWDAAGVARAPAEIVQAGDGPAAADRLDAGHGTVWVADNRQGWHGGGDYTRWLLPGSDPAETVTWFRARAHRIRVMPLLQGVPCSIHGFVTPQGVAAFRPIEMVILRRTDRPQFVYGSVASFWDPPDADRQEMREAARRVGLVLRNQVDYRGPFSIDGVLTEDGFRPTELNPRLSAGLLLQARAVDGLDLEAVTRALTDGLIDLDAVWLEDVVVTAADQTRAGGMILPLPTPVDEQQQVGIEFVDDGARVTDAPEPALLRVGPASQGCLVQLKLAAHHPAGPSVAPQAIAAARLADELWKLDIPPLMAAPDVRHAV